MPNRSALSSAVVVLSVLTPVPADACSCSRPNPVCQEFWSADAVFVGRVESLSRVPITDGSGEASSLVVTFAVQEVFKGAVRSTVTVRTGSVEHPCEYPFRTERQYLVYAYSGGGGAMLQTQLCSRTRPAERAADDLRYVRSVTTPLLVGQTDTARVTGRAILRGRDLARRRDIEQPIPDVIVTVTGERGSVQTISDAGGVFLAAGLPPGKYRVSVEPPPGFEASIAPTEFELKHAQACIDLAAALRSVVAVRGRVVDRRGEPMPGVTVDLTVPHGLDDVPGPDRMRALTARDGTFEVRGVPSGRFVVVIDLTRGPTSRLIYPGVERLPDARLVTVHSGVDVVLNEFVIPDHHPFAQITGIVVDSAGRPAPGARVFLAGAEPGDPILGEPAITDMSGQFVLSAPAGQDYRIFAERARAGSDSGQLDGSVATRLALSSTNRTLQKLVLRRLR